MGTSATEPPSGGWGPTTHHIAANVLRLRNLRGLSTTALSAALKEVGHSIPPTGITRIEKGQRRVDVDDLTALAVVLRTSPMALLLPWSTQPDELVEVTGLGVRAASDVWQWADGQSPASTSDTDPRGDIQRYWLDSRPPWTRAEYALRPAAPIRDARQSIAV